MELSERTRERLEVELDMSAAEVDDVVALINSRLPASMSGVFA